MPLTSIQRAKIKPVSVHAIVRPTRVRYWVLVFTVTLAVITYIDRVAISFALPYIGKELNLSSIQKGWILTAFGLAYALFEIPGDVAGRDQYSPHGDAVPQSGQHGRGGIDSRQSY